MTTTAKTEASTYYVKGGRTGKMLHRGTERGAGTACGKWLRSDRLDPLRSVLPEPLVPRWAEVSTPT